MQDDLPVPGGPATMIPGEVKQTKHIRSKMSALEWGKILSGKRLRNVRYIFKLLNYIVIYLKDV